LLFQVDEPYDDRIGDEEEHEDGSDVNEDAYVPPAESPSETQVSLKAKPLTEAY
jgi:hypothetical protein